MGWWLVADGWQGGGMMVGLSQDFAGFWGDPLKWRKHIRFGVFVDLIPLLPTRLCHIMPRLVSKKNCHLLRTYKRS